MNWIECVQWFTFAASAASSNQVHTELASQSSIAATLPIPDNLPDPFIGPRNSGSNSSTRRRSFEAIEERKSDEMHPHVPKSLREVDVLQVLPRARQEKEGMAVRACVEKQLCEREVLDVLLTELSQEPS